MARSLYRRAARLDERAGAARLFLCLVLALGAAPALGGECCAGTGKDGGVAITPFSAAGAGGAIPAPWAGVKINDRKTPTRYSLVDDGGTVVLYAQADSAASALGHPVNAALTDTPWLHWRWKVAAPIASADPSAAQKEDSPARVVLEFDGDRSKLPLSDRAVNQLSENLSGKPLPYATLMYIFSQKLPVGTVVANPHTRRIQMIVVDSGAAVGTWQTFVRNVVEDYKRAFKEEPQKLLSLGVLTDTDNTGERAQAWYGDFSLTSQR
ncbi:MAG TPA: DUF3047 domain-containing protein [Casimicrobiaceae bacterium]|jgi:Protein of unknown function (DUF3047)|nr:DUF3047 domain-containing protein [Casimicrobiaceae bacterium]